MNFLTLVCVPVVIFGYISKRQSFIILHEHCITNSSREILSGPHYSRNKMICGLLCGRTTDCDAAEFDQTNLHCKLFTNTTANPLSTNIADGFTVLKGRRRKIDIKFDPTRLHVNKYISPDLTVLSDHQQQGVQRWPTVPTSLYNYPGAVVSNCVCEGYVVSIDFTYQFTIIQALTPSGITVEAGLADKSKIERSAFCGDLRVGGWSYLIDECGHGRICLQSWHSSSVYKEYNWGSSVPGSSTNGTFTLVVDRKMNTFSLYNKDNNQKLFTFTGITKTGILCPSFGVYGPEYLKSTIRLLAAYVLL